MAKPTQLANAPDLTRYPAVKVVNLALYPKGSRVQYCPDGRRFVWYPRLTRYTVTFTVPPCCPTCGRALSSGTVDEELAI